MNLIILYTHVLRYCSTYTSTIFYVLLYENSFSIIINRTLNWPLVYICGYILFAFFNSFIIN